MLAAYHVTYWSLGNEVWGGWMGGVHCNAKDYAERLVLYAAAMKRVDPSIRLIASGLWGDWDRTVLSDGGRTFRPDQRA